MTDLVSAEVGIRQLQSRYIDSVWRKDYAAFADCFTEDAQWLIAGQVFCGPGACVACLKEFMPRFDRVKMTMGSPILEVGEGVATGRTEVIEHNILIDRTRNITIGTYYDRFVEQDGRWRFAWHFYQLYYLGPPDMTGDFYEIADYGPPHAMPDADAPTVRL